MPKPRDAGIDALRTAVTLLVVLHHSILAYANFGFFDRTHYLWSTAPVVDGQRWVGFDLLIAFNDGWFMAAMFAIAGLFVVPGLRRHGPATYMRRRALRLGLPFVIAAVVIMPLAYYPSYRLTGATDSYWRFWCTTLLGGPWSAGPAWFLWVLLTFDAACATLVAAFGTPGVVPPKLLLRYGVAAAMAGSVGSLLIFGPGFWLSAGPFSVQASRVVLYAASFGIGVIAGPSLPGWRVSGWPVTCLASFVALVTLHLLRPELPVTLWRAAYGIIYVVFCFATGLSAFALARSLPARALGWLQRIGPDAFWIYVIHYLPLTWLQYMLLDVRLGAPLKATVVFTLTMTTSWAAAASLRMARRRFQPQRIPSTSVMS